MASKRRILLYISAAAIIILLAVFFYVYRRKIGRIVSPFFMAVVIAYLVQPLVKRLERLKIERRAGILLVYLLFLLVTAAVIVFLAPGLVSNTKELANTLPDITLRYQAIFDGLLSTVQSSKWPQDVKAAVFREIQNGAQTAQAVIMDILKKTIMTFIDIVAALFDLVLAMVIAYYFVKDAELFKSLVLYLVPRKWRNGITGAGREINQVLSNFIQGQLLTAIIVGLLESAGLVIAGVKYPLVLGMIGGLANIIPYFGPIIGVIPAAAVALIQSPVKAVWAVAVFSIVQQIDNAFISSKIIEGKVGLHPVTTMLVVLVGGEFFGIAGMLLSVPVTAILKIVVKRLLEAVV